MRTKNKTVPGLRGAACTVVCPFSCLFIFSPLLLLSLDNTACGGTGWTLTINNIFVIFTHHFHSLWTRCCHTCPPLPPVDAFVFVEQRVQHSNCSSISIEFWNATRAFREEKKKAQKILFLLVFFKRYDIHTGGYPSLKTAR